MTSLAAPRADSRDSSFALLLGLLLALFFTLLVRSAWVCDDAYITFRVIDNLWNGYGLRWNVIDRVQAYTHPLWMMVMAVFYGLTRDVYYTSLAVQIASSFGAAWILCFRVAASPAHALLALWALILSKALVDYSTSGMENPLQHLLLAVFAWEYFYQAPLSPSAPHPIPPHVGGGNRLRKRLPAFISRSASGPRAPRTRSPRSSRPTAPRSAAAGGP